MENVDEVWQRLIEFREWCHSKARGWLEEHPRRRSYVVVYDNDGCMVETYAAIDDADLQKIEAFVAKARAECGASGKELRDVMSAGLEGLDIDWGRYYPDSEMYRSYEVRPRIVDVRLDDVVSFTRFKVKHTDPYDENDVLISCFCNFKLNDEQYVELLSARLFDKHLSFYDLRVINKAIYDEIEACCYEHHQSHVVFMTEINEVAASIMLGVAPEDKSVLVDFTDTRIGFALNAILTQRDKYDDARLLRAIAIAGSDPMRGCQHWPRVDEANSLSREQARVVEFRDYELWEFVRTPAKHTGLPYQIWVDNGAAYKNHDHELWLYVEVDGVKYPVTIEERPRLLLSILSPRDEAFDFDELAGFIRANRTLLKRLADGETNYLEFLRQLTRVEAD